MRVCVYLRVGVGLRVGVRIGMRRYVCVRKRVCCMLGVYARVRPGHQARHVVGLSSGGRLKQRVVQPPARVRPSRSVSPEIRIEDPAEA